MGVVGLGRVVHSIRREMVVVVVVVVCVCVCGGGYSDIFIHMLGPQGFWGSGENGYLFSGSWGALVIIFRDLGSKLIVLGI